MILKWSSQLKLAFRHEYSLQSTIRIHWLWNFGRRRPDSCFSESSEYSSIVELLNSTALFVGFTLIHFNEFLADPFFRLPGCSSCVKTIDEYLSRLQLLFFSADLSILCFYVLASPSPSCYLSVKYRGGKKKKKTLTDENRRYHREQWSVDILGAIKKV